MKLLKYIVLNYTGWGFFGLSILVVGVLLGKAYQQVGEIERDDILKEINLSLDNGTRVKLRLNQEGGKPEILTSDNYPVLSYGHLDSTLNIDGKIYPLWEQVSNYRVDRRNKQIAYTISTPEDNLKRTYVLEQNIKFLDKDTTLVEYYFIWNYPDNVSGEVGKVELKLAHFNQGLGGLGVMGNTLRGQTQIAARRGKDGGSPISYVPFELTMQGSNALANLNYVRAGSETAPGFLTSYTLANPERGKRTFIASEIVKLGNTYP